MLWSQFSSTHQLVKLGTCVWPLQYWDDTIADMAQRYAESCPRGHNTQEDRNVQGE